MQLYVMSEPNGVEAVEATHSSEHDSSATSSSGFDVILTHERALEQFLEENESDILPNWSTDDLSALLSNIMKYQCSESSIKNFVNAFEDTTVDDISCAIQELRNINKKASKKRVLLRTVKDRNHVPRSQSSKHDFHDFSAAASIISKARRIGDDTSVVLPKFFSEIAVEQRTSNIPISNSPYVRPNNLMGAPNFVRIYKHIAAIMSSRSILKGRSLDAAVILNIFDEMESVVEQFPEHIAFFEAFFREIKDFDLSEFFIAEPLNAENIGIHSSNIFNFVDEMLNVPFLDKQ